MKIVIFLAAVSAANIFVGIDGAGPTPKLTMLGAKGYQISFGSDPGIERCVVHVNINRDIKLNEDGDLIVPIKPTTHGEWIYKNDTANLRIDDKINCWTMARCNGVLYTYKIPTLKVPPVSKL